MGLFSALKSGVKGAFTATRDDLSQKYQGNKDFLEAVCAAAALVAAADGEVEDKEIESVLETAKNNTVLSAAYKETEIEDCVMKMCRKAKSRSGKADLYRELEDIKDARMKEDVLYMAIDVSESDGEMEEAEKPVLAKIAKTLGLDINKYMD